MATKSTMPKDLQQKIKNINRRLKTLETKGLTRASAAYRSMMDYATKTPMSKNAKVSQGIYNVDYVNQAVRLKGPADWDNMSIEEQQKLREVVENIWNNPESSTSAYQVQKQQNKAFESYLESHPEAKDQGLTQEAYGELWHAADRLRADKNSHFSSDQVVRLLRDFNVDEILAQSQTAEIQNRLSREHSTALEFALSQYNEGTVGGGRRLATIFPGARRRT